MFTIIYPVFERGRILKKELLMTLRDYSFGQVQLQFDKWTDGILLGCDISVEEKQLHIAPGMLKWNGFIYAMVEVQKIDFTATEQVSVLKIQFSTLASTATDYERYAGKFVLDNSTSLLENELELCRFKLKEGNRLRSDYTGFTDMQTEYDTVHLAHATWAGIERQTLALPILRQFAKEAFVCNLQNAWDIYFCGQCMSGQTIHRDVLLAYIRSHGEHITGKENGVQLYEMLVRILDKLKRNIGTTPQTPRKRPLIVVD